MMIKVVRQLGCLVLMFLYAQTASTTLVYADKVVVVKSERTLYLYKNNRIIEKYPIRLGGNPLGHKQRRGDSRTPEGQYTIDYRNPKSRFHLSLHISYPHKQDLHDAKIAGRDPGGEIFIHGLPNGFKRDYLGIFKHDWTDGCIAVSNDVIKVLWRSIRNGTPIEIRP